MSTTDISPDPLATTTATASARDADAGTPGVFAATATWLTSVDSKVTGAKLAGTAVVTLIAVAIVGVLLGIERIDGADTLFDDGALLQMFVAFRVGLVFGVLVPLLLGIAIAVVPMQVGARSLAFPRLAAAGFWAWLGGLVCVIVSLAANGGPGGGDAQMVELFLAGLALLVIGLAAIAVPLATTVLTTRAPGMRMSRVPFFAWASLVAAVGLLLVLPVLVGVIIYLFVDHQHARALFGGNVGIGGWIGFALTQPATYLYALPAIGVFAELVPVTFRKRMPMRGVVYAGLALVGSAALAGTTQQILFGLPLDGSGGDNVADLVTWALFLLLPLLGAVIVLGGLAIAAKPGDTPTRPNVGAPILFALLGLLLVIAGMIATALLAITDLGLQGTVFEEAALVLVTYGGLLGALGGIAWWLPKWSGKVLPTGPGMGLALLGAAGVALAALPYVIAGFADQPAGSGLYDYSGPAELWNVLVTVGHALVLLTVVGFAALALKPSRDAVADDPSDGQTLEWATTSPAPIDNYSEVLTVMSPEPALDRRGAEEAAR
jgi:cytochrome o ubiquinol oxidase subunit 1